MIEDNGLFGTGRYNISLTKIPSAIRPGIYNSCPATGLSVSNSLNLLEWDAVSGATGYDLYFGEGVTNALAKGGTNFLSSSFPLPPVQAGHRYVWHVVAHTPGGLVDGPYLWFTVGVPSIQFTDFILLPDKRFQFTLRGRLVEPVRIQASVDLSNWTTLITLPSLDCYYGYTDSTATNFTRRFYRAVSP